MEKTAIEFSSMQMAKSAKACVSLLCLAMACGLAGCGNKGASDTKTPQEVNAFKGHQPTPEQLQAAMPHVAPMPAQAPAPAKQ